MVNSFTGLSSFGMGTNRFGLPNASVVNANNYTGQANSTGMYTNGLNTLSNSGASSGMSGMNTLGMSGLTGLTGGTPAFNGDSYGFTGQNQGFGQLGIAGSTLQLMSQINAMMASVMTGLMSFIQVLMQSYQQKPQSTTGDGSTSGTTSGTTPTSTTPNTTPGKTTSNTKPIAKGRNSDGSNVLATRTMSDYKKRFATTNLGIWGDEAHKKRKSDHNSGDAADLGVSSIKQGKAVADALIQEAEARGVKYIIFNHKIWSPDRKDEGWRPYSGSDPHTGHVHASFYA